MKHGKGQKIGTRDSNQSNWSSVPYKNIKIKRAAAVITNSKQVKIEVNEVTFTQH